ncbi:MAG: hypothetical protein FWD59_08900, partial [Micrococcales bacterium]|nr:hypothetical protein [Micrococcales bacterium]
MPPILPGPGRWGVDNARTAVGVADLGLGEPQFLEMPGRLRVVLPIHNHRPLIAPEPGTTRGVNGPVREDDGPGSDHDAEWSEDDASKREDDAHEREDDGAQREDDARVGRKGLAILRAAVERPAHRDDLLAAAGLGMAWGNHARHIAPLVEQGLLAMTIPDAPRSKNQRYR